MSPYLVSSEWLHTHLKDPNLIILDASQPSDPAAIRIKGARIFDIKHVFSDTDSGLPNTLPAPEAFEKSCRELGIRQDSKLVVYDRKGIYTSPRVWWMFQTMGHTTIAVLNGGLPDWIAKGYETETGLQAAVSQGNFVANLDASRVKSIDRIQENLESQEAIVLDARSKGRFEGTAPEPRAGLSSGHMPHSVSLPYTEVLEEGKYKSTEALQAVFEGLKLDDRPFIFSCGSGITACIILLASEMAMDRPTAVFDGSWTEWALTEGMPIEGDK